MSRSLTLCVLVLSVLAPHLQGCSERSSPAGDGPPGSDPRDERPGDADGGDEPDASVHLWTKQEACLAMYAATCERWGECLGDSLAADCLALIGAYCPDYAFSEGSTYTIESAVSCAEERAQQSCVGVQRDSPACARAGVLPGGSPCRFGRQCQSGRCTETGDCGVCFDLPPPDAGCPQGGTASCGLHRYCPDEATGCVPVPETPVVPELQEGESCSDRFDGGAYYGALEQRCAAGLVCTTLSIGGAVCKPVPKEGQRCATNSFCPKPLVCVTTPSTWLCLQPRQSGESCYPGECAAGLVCGTSRVCGPPAAPGSPCVANEQCADGGYCDFSQPSLAPHGTCQAGRALGQDCAAFNADGGRVQPTCTGGTCQTQSAADGGWDHRCLEPPAGLGQLCTPLKPCFGALRCGDAGVCEYQQCGAP